MRIGILTFHRAYNYGAFMQCYSLSNEVKKHFPEASVEVIDYASENMLGDYNRSFWQCVLGNKRTNGNKPLVIITKRLAKNILNYKKYKVAKQSKKKLYRSFDESLKHLMLSCNSLVSDDSGDFKNFIQDKYDIIIVGSDAIWNDNQTTSPNLYFLPYITDCHKLSYAASMYGMDYSSKSAAERAYIEDCLHSFAFVGVRDSETEEYIKSCTNGHICTEHTCDPSLFLKLDSLAVSEEDLKKKLKESGVDFSRPLVGLMCSEWLAKEVRRNLGDGFQYVSVYSPNGYEDVFLDNLTPFEWAKVFSFFDVTFTHFFHGTLFSIKNGTLTYSIEKNTDYKKKYKTKIQDVLGRLNLTQDCYREFDEMDNNSWESIKENILKANPTLIKEKYFDAVAKEAQTKDAFFDVLHRIIKGD